jgi:uncharacterized membrane protein YdjX (TVP38/TMEM64 family)
MEQIITQVVEYITNLMSSLGLFSGFVLIILESIIPVLPLSVFVALNVITFGSLFGFIISWLATVIGCMLAFTVCRKLRDKFDKKYGKNETVKKFKKYLNKISYSNLVVLLAMPFTPAFAVNIGAGLSEIDKKKYFSALMIGKIPMIYFWGFIGKSFLESISDPYTIAQIIVMLILAYLASKVISKFIG